jgi:hypothetical protein
MAHKKPERRAIPPEHLRDALLGPLLVQLSERVRAAESVTPMSGPWTGKRAALIHEGLVDWLRSRDSAALIRLFEAAPEALAIPSVVGFIQRLRRLARRVQFEDLGAPVWLGDEDPVPLGTCKAAADLLRALAGSAASGVMGFPGWTVQPPTRRGRPRRTFADYVESMDILFDYEEVLQYLPEQNMRRKPGERENAWIARRKRLIMDAWANSIGGQIKFSEPTTMDELPEPVIDDIERASRDEIAYRLIGHRYRMADRSVRAQVEAARK